MKIKLLNITLTSLAVAGAMGLLNSPALPRVSGSEVSAPCGQSAQYAGGQRGLNNGLTLGSAAFVALHPPGPPSGYGVRLRGFSVVSPALPWALPVLLAQINTSSIDAQTLDFLRFVQRLLILPALGLAVWSAWCFHDNKLRDAVLSLVGAFLCSVAVPIVKALFGY